jgi:iron complex outermembrane receptor protein
VARVTYAAIAIDDVLAMKLQRSTSTTFLAAGTLAVICVRAAVAADDLAGLDLSTLMSMDVTLVTAQKRTEDVTTVPISMTVLKSQDARQAHLDSTYDLQQTVPGLTTSVTQGLIVPYIRGIGTENNVSIEPSVSVYVDDVYQADRVQTFMDLADLEQIEVLKGPQGTLYGRNATGGAIKIRTRGPTEQLEGSAQVTAGNFNLRDSSLFVAGPFSDRVRASVAAHVRERDALYQNTLGIAEPKSEDFYSLHGRVQFDITPDLEAELLLKYLDRKDGLGSPTRVGGPSIPELSGIAVSSDPLKSTVDVTDTLNQISNTNTALKLNWNGPLVHIRSTMAYNELSYRSAQDLDGSAAPLLRVNINGPSHAFTHEWQLSPAQTSGHFDWLTGFFYIDNTLGYNPLSATFLIPGAGMVTGLTMGEVRTTAMAGFGELTFRSDSGLSLTAGARYSHEKKSFEDAQNGLQGLPLLSYADQSHAWDNVSYRVVGKYSVGHSMLYAKTETAFKSGVFNVFAPPIVGPTRPEKITAYEIGVKHGFAGIPLHVSAAAFYNDYRDQQLQLVDATGTNAFFTVAPKSRTNGIDAGLDAKLGAHWTVNAGLEWLDAKYRDFTSDGILVTNPAGGHSVASNLDVAGNHLSRAPEYTANLGLAFDYPLLGGSVFGSTNYYRSGRIYWDPANIYVQKPFDVLNASAGYRFDSGWQLAAWAKNLSGTRYLSGLILTPLGANGTFAEPRTYGLTVQYEFGR